MSVTVLGVGVGGEKSQVRLSQGRQGQTRLLSMRTSEDFFDNCAKNKPNHSSQNNIFPGS